MLAEIPIIFYILMLCPLPAAISRRKTMAHKYSRQRELIREFMLGRTDHPTADAVYINVRKELPNISLGTVYRNLMLLADTGELIKVDIGDGTLHFDPSTDEHSHFICNCCGKIEDLRLKNSALLIREAEELTGADVKSHSAIFRGLCKKCSEASR